MTATEFKEPNEPVAATWTSADWDVLGAVVGSGGVICTTPDSAGDGPPDSGSVESCAGSGPSGDVDGPAGDGTLTDVTDLPQQAVGMLPLVGLFAAAGLAVHRGRQR